MQKFKPQFTRLIFIDRKIRQKTFPNSTGMAREYEVSSRTIHRDIEYMRDMLNAPIEYDNEKKGFYYSEENYALPAIDIRESDLFAICVAEKALEQYANTPLYDKLAAVFEKIRVLLPQKVSVNPSWIDNKFTFLPESFTAINPVIWETISEGLRTTRRIDITHQKAGEDTATDRTVCPYHIVNYRGEWYLIGHCSLRNAVVRFAMSRIRSARLTEECFSVPPDFDFKAFMGSHFGIMTGEEMHQVKIQFSREQAPYVQERTWHADQSIIENADGSIILSFSTSSLFEVKRWILSWGAAARVLAPDQLVSQIRDEYARAGVNYS